jgi:glycerophosphoryl diester phosphodiesterase
VQQRLPSLLDRPIAFAHRGARAHAPENTLEAFRLALRLGATGLESDIWLTADGVPVLDHDGVVRSGLRKRPLSDVLRVDVPAHIPTLSELLDLCPPGVQISLDLKAPGSGERVLQVIRSEFPAVASSVWLCHHSRDGLLPLRPLSDDVKLVNSTRLERIKEGPERRAAQLASAGIDGINLHHTDWNGGLVALFHRFERTAFAWDLQHEPVLRSLLRMGIDGIFSDWVDRMVDAYTAELGRPDGKDD